MNTNSPLVPQGSMPPKGKSTIKIAFFTIVALHVVVIGGMLMQGCSKDKAAVAQTTEDPNAQPGMAPTQTDTLAQTPTPTENLAPANPANNATGQQNQKVSVYYASVTLQPGKEIRYLTLPNISQGTGTTLAMNGAVCSFRP